VHGGPKGPPLRLNVAPSVQDRRLAYMEIRFVSSLTPEDEARVARTLANAVGTWLDGLPLLYTLQITTSAGVVTTRRSVNVDALDDDEVPA
jgi:hypothetical protein